MSVYVIKPLEKKSIIYHVEMFRENADGTVSWFNIDETYRWGQGFIEEDMDCNLPFKGDPIAYAKPDAGWGCEFDDSVSVEWEFSDDIPELEQQELKELYYEGGAGWLYDGEHEWQEEDAAVHIIAPYQVDLCQADGTVIKENVKLKSRPKIKEDNTNWPFPPFQTIANEVNNNWPFPPTKPDTGMTPEEEEAWRDLESKQPKNLQ